MHFQAILFKGNQYLFQDLFSRVGDFYKNRKVQKYTNLVASQ